MNLLNLLEVDKYPKINYHSDLLMVYQKGGLGEFWASKYYNEYYGHIPNPIMKTHNVIRNDPVHKDYIDVFLYTKQLYTPYAYWLWDIEVVEPLLKHMNDDWCNKEIAKQIEFANRKSQLFTGWPDLPKEFANASPLLAISSITAPGATPLATDKDSVILAISKAACSLNPVTDVKVPTKSVISPVVKLKAFAVSPI